MRIQVSHPDYPQYDFWSASFDPVVEAQIDRLGPNKIITSAYDWPDDTYPYHGWTDTINSLWWPRGADQFASCLLILDDTRHALLKASIAAQAGAAGSASPRPYIVLRAVVEAKFGPRPAEAYTPAGMVSDDVGADGEEMIAWKLYPLPPVRLTEVSADDRFEGMWLLPLVDIRYWYRSTPLLHRTAGSASGSVGSDVPLLRLDYDNLPDWFPPVRGYPDDAAAPLDYEPIEGLGTSPAVTGDMARGHAGIIQAMAMNVRVVCRDVRSNWNATGDCHTAFTGVLADYPDATDLDLATSSSYHEDAIRLAEEPRNRVAGGRCDPDVVDDLVAHKLHFLFPLVGGGAWYGITIGQSIEDPQSEADLAEVGDLTEAERQHVPRILMGVESPGPAPTGETRAALVRAAKQWAMLYYRWRRKQVFYKFPGIAPLIPNGYASVIRWDFSAQKMETTYVAVEGVEGTEDAGGCCERPGTWGRIDGEGSVADGLDGKYAWTELEDVGGDFAVRAGGIVGYVRDVNGAAANYNYAQDDTGKRAVPVGLRVFMKPGVPYLDIETGQVFDHYRFTTPDLLQVIRLRLTGERNSRGHHGAVVRRWNPDVNDFVDSELIWAVLLT